MAVTDTHPDVASRMDALVRGMTPSQKMAHAARLTALMRRLALAKIEVEHPDESDREHRLRLLSRSAPRALMLSAFGWDPEVRGR